MTDLAALVVRMQADNSSYIKALDQATGKLSKFSHDQESLLDDLAKKFAAAFTIDKIIEFSAGAEEGAAQLAKFSQEAGVSVETLSALKIAMAGSGVDTDGLATAFKKLNVAASDAAGNATGKAGLAFGLLGVNVKDANGDIKDAATLNDEVADAFSKSADGANKVAIAVALYGKQGQQMIPTLNQGSAALHEQEAAAIASGAALSGPAAEAAEAAEKKFAQLSATIKGQLANAITTDLTPALNDVATAFTGATNNSVVFQLAGQGIALAFRAIASIVAEVGRELETVVVTFKGVGAYGAAAAQAVQGNFAEAKAIIADFNAENEATQKKYAAIQAKIWSDGADAQVAAAKKGAEGAAGEAAKKPPLGNLTGAIEAAAAVKELEKFNEGLQSQAQAFGLGGAALVNYKLQYGPLADAIKKAGDEGDILAGKIRANAQALQTKQDTKAVTDYTDKLQEQITKYGQGTLAASDYATHTGDLGKTLDRLGPAGETARAKIHALAVEQLQLSNSDAFAHIDQQLLTLSGHLTQAAAAAFDFNNKLLIKNVAAAGTDQQKAQLDQLRQAEVLQAAYTEEVNKSSAAQLQYGTVEADVQLAQSKGQITDLQAMQQLDVARQQEITDLTAIYEAQKKIADQSGDPKLIQEAQATANSIKGLEAQTNQLANTMRNDLVNDASTAFEAVETGAKGAKAAVADFFKDLQKQLLQMANKDIAQSIFGTGGAGGGISGMLAGLFGGGGAGGASIFGGGATSVAATGAAATGTDLGALASTIPAFAAGGTLGAGGVGLVGENGPELVYSGAHNLNVVPAGQGKSVSVTNHFTTEAPGGVISRQSQMQMAAAAARSLGQANHRNNR